MTANVENLTPFIEGKRAHGGRKAGTLNRVTRLLKHATIDAAQLSKHSDGTLRGYLIFLADEHPNLFANLLGKMYPVQMKAELTSSFERPERLTSDMPLDVMVRTFEHQLKSGYQPQHVIEHDDDANGDGDD